MSIYQKSFNVITWKDLKKELSYINDIISYFEKEDFFTKELHSFTHIGKIDTLEVHYTNQVKSQYTGDQKVLGEKKAKFLKAVYNFMQQHKIDFIDFTICG